MKLKKLFIMLFTFIILVMGSVSAFADEYDVEVLPAIHRDIGFVDINVGKPNVLITLGQGPVLSEYTSNENGIIQLEDLETTQYRVIFENGDFENFTFNVPNSKGEYIFSITPVVEDKNRVRYAPDPDSEYPIRSIDEILADKEKQERIQKEENKTKLNTEVHTEALTNKITETTKTPPITEIQTAYYNEAITEHFTETFAEFSEPITQSINNEPVKKEKTSPVLIACIILIPAVLAVVFIILKNKKS